MCLKNFLRVCLLSGFFFCASSVGQSLNTAVTGQNLTTTAKTAFMPNGFFTFRRDLRKCAAPFCGGFFVKAVNRSLTRCIDGKLRAECYVININNPNGINLALAGLLKGRILFGSFPTAFGIFGVFDLQSAYRPATLKTGVGLFVGIRNNGLMCNTSPCFFYDEYLLNSNVLRKISGLDLTTVGASAKVLEQIRRRIGNGEVVLASGYNVRTHELAGPGITFRATQVYLPLKNIL
jgi:hypothetical protein